MGNGALLSWVVHPVFDNWKRSAVLIAFLIMLIAVVYFASQSVYLTLLSLFFLAGALYKYFVPFHYQVDNKKVTIQSFLYCFEQDWTNFRSFYIDQNGILLSPFAQPSRLENFRGVYVRFGNNKGAVIDFVKQQIPLSVESTDII